MLSSVAIQRKPASAASGDHRVRHRPFGGPEPRGRPAEQALVARTRARELLGGVLGMPERPARHRRLRMRAQVDVRVAQQRQDRVVERRGRQLHLAALLRRAVGRNHAPEDLELDRPEDELVVFAEVASLGDQRPHARVVVEVGLVDPGQLVPDLQVAQVVVRERLHAMVEGRASSPAVLPSLSAQPQQFGVPRVRLDHPRARRVEEVGHHGRAVRLGQARRRLQAQLQVAIAGPLLGERLELDEQRRHQVEGHPDPRELARAGPTMP